MSKLLPKRFRLITSITLSVLLSSTQTAYAKSPTIDVSIIQESDALSPYLNQEQRIAFREASKLVEEGQANVRSGTRMVERKPSALNPNENLGPARKKGKALIQKGNTKIQTGQKELVALLTQAQEQRAESLEAAAKKYDIELTEASYEAAFEQASKDVLSACNEADYEHILFDRLQIITTDGVKSTNPDVSNAAYDTLTKIDGMNYKVAIPLGLTFTKLDDSESYTFQYENAVAFSGDKTALLAIEIVSPTEGPEALLSMRAFDIDTQQLLASSVTYIADASAVLLDSNKIATTTNGTEEVASDADATESADIEQVARTIPSHLSINDERQIIETLAGLPTPYTFDIAINTDNSMQNLIVSALLKETLLANSQLILVENDYIQRTYLPTEAAPSEISNVAGATLQIDATDDENYSIAAEAHNSGRVVEVGSLTLQLP